MSFIISLKPMEEKNQLIYYVRAFDSNCFKTDENSR